MKTTEQLNAELTELRQEIASAKASLSLLVGREIKLREQRITSIHGIEPGSIVRITKGDSTGKLAKVARMSREWGSGGTLKPWLLGYVAKKDGTFSTAERNLFDGWELATPSTLAGGQS